MMETVVERLLYDRLFFAFVIYFVNIVPMNRIIERARRQIEVAEPSAPTKERFCSPRYAISFGDSSVCSNPSRHMCR